MPDNIEIKANLGINDAAQKIRIIKDDITRQDTDVIVNAANNSLLGGGGVDGAIHRAAGPRLLDECRGVGGCPTGEARITQAYNLPCRYVVHTVGPIWKGGNQGEAKLLAACYANSLKLAADYQAKTISFPSISAGAYGFPLKKACRIALAEIKNFLNDNQQFIEVRLACFIHEDMVVYKNVFREII